MHLPPNEKDELMMTRRIATALIAVVLSAGVVSSIAPAASADTGWGRKAATQDTGWGRSLK